MNDCLTALSTPQLTLIHQGKVRESYRVDEETRMIVVTDRISAFDRILDCPIPDKGAVLNLLAEYWFNLTQKIIPNHLIRVVDPNVSLVKEAVPIRVEMVVRAYLTGSMWRRYEKGVRLFSGIEMPDGLTKNQKLAKPILTPTTKEESDREMAPEDLIKEGFVDEESYGKMAEAALELFEFGTQHLSPKGILLVDTKYEFGRLGNELILIDEIHTPDSSRFWAAKAYGSNPTAAESMDKEFVRGWLLKNKDGNTVPADLPSDVVAETSRRYREIFKAITGADFSLPDEPLRARLVRHLVDEKIIKEGYVAIIMGSPADLEHARTVAAEIEKYDIPVDIRIISAHKNGEDLTGIAAEYNHSLEPGVIVAIAGLSNSLGGAISANVNLPVVSCPPFENNQDIMLNVGSSLMMPSKTPAALVVKPKNAALAALRSLNLPSLRSRFLEEIKTMKQDLRAADRKVRGR